jgi:DNA-binding transcriptional LysR family regulator
MFDWEDLRHFAALAQNGSLLAAARALRVEHATVARRVAALERSLDAKLVDRRPRAYVLTAHGRRIAALALRVQEQTFAVERAAQAASPQVAGDVTISSPPTMARMLIAPRLWELRAQHPDIIIRLMGETRLTSLARREADIAICWGRPTEKRAVARKVASIAFGLYASSAYLARHSPERYAFVGYDESADGLPSQEWLKSIAGSRPMVFRSSELEAQATAARTGIGIAALPQYVAEQDPQLVRVDIAGRPLFRHVWLTVHQDMRRVAAIRAVMEFLTGCFQ